MISYIDIRNAITDILEKNIKGIEKVKVEGNLKTMPRPSIFVSFRPIKSINYQFTRNKLLNVDIVYLSKKQTHTDFLLMQEQLENLFYLKLDVKDRSLNILDTSCAEIEKELHFSFTLDYSVEQIQDQEQNTEKASEISIDIGGM